MEQMEFGPGKLNPAIFLRIILKRGREHPNTQQFVKLKTLHTMKYGVVIKINDCGKYS